MNEQQDKQHGKGRVGNLCFGAYRLDITKRLLYKTGNRLQPIPPLPLKLLACLLEQSGKAVHKHEIIRALWPEVQPPDEAEDRLRNVCQHLFIALDDTDREHPVYVSRKNNYFTFLQPVLPCDSSTQPEAETHERQQETGSAFKAMLRQPAVRQTLHWQARRDDLPTGVWAKSKDREEFIPWPILKPELERELLSYAGRLLGDQRCTVATGDFHGRADWLIHILGENGQHIGYIWLGKDPDNNWYEDGLVRIGEAIDDYTHTVWHIFQRYSDGSYRRIAALDTPNDRR